jgi:hypothetical protein
LRKEVPIAIGFVVGLIVLLEYFLKGLMPAIVPAAQTAQTWGTIISALAMALAAANLLIVHGRRIRQKQEDWWMSIIVYAGMISMTVAGISSAMEDLYTFLFDGLFQPLGTAMFSMMVFFIASAARRAFRARNIDGALLLISGVIVMIGNAPIGNLISPFFGKGTEWLMKIPNVAGNRAIMIGAALGMVVTGFRVMVGIDRSYFGGE